MFAFSTRTQRTALLLPCLLLALVFQPSSGRRQLLKEARAPEFYEVPEARLHRRQPIAHFDDDSDDEECRQCCGLQVLVPKSRSEKVTELLDTRAASNDGTHHVKLATTEIIKCGPFSGYHTSVIVDNEEIMFGEGGGIGRFPLQNGIPPTHDPDSVVIQSLGKSPFSVDQVLAVLRQHFEPGSYDLLLKNCNSFSDMALYALLGKRLTYKRRYLERLGSWLPTSLREQFLNEETAGAAAYDSDKVLQAIQEQLPA